MGCVKAARCFAQSQGHPLLIRRGVIAAVTPRVSLTHFRKLTT